MRQNTLAEAGFKRYGQWTRRERFLEEMERIAPWKALYALIEPVYYPKHRGAGIGRWGDRLNSFNPA